jgi:hypothetical protein
MTRTHHKASVVTCALKARTYHEQICGDVNVFLRASPRRLLWFRRSRSAANFDRLSVFRCGVTETGEQGEPTADIFHRIFRRAEFGGDTGDERGESIAIARAGGGIRRQRGVDLHDDAAEGGESIENLSADYSAPPRGPSEPHCAGYMSPLSF